MAYTIPDLPTAPTLLSNSIPSQYALDIPDVPSRLDTFERVISANKTNARLNAWRYTRYGDAVQNLIDAQITSLLSDSGDTEFWTKVGIIKENLLYQAQKESEEVLIQAGSKGHMILPGGYKKQIYDIEKLTKKQLEQEIFKLFEDSAKISQANLEFAIQEGIAKEAKLLKHHHSVQMANADAAITIAKNLYQTYTAQVALYNTELAEYEIALQNINVQREDRLNEMRAYLSKLDAYIIEGQNKVFDDELIKAGINLVNLENEINLTNLELIETDIAVKRGTLLIYKASLEQYMAELEVIGATYAGYMAEAKSANVDKEIYLQNLRQASLDVKEASFETERQKMQVKRDIADARNILEQFKNLVEEFNTLMSVSRVRYDVVKSDYSNDLQTFTTALNDALNDTKQQFEINLSSMEEEGKLEIGLETNSGDLSVDNYRSRLQKAFISGKASFLAATKEAKAEYESAADTTLNLVHEITEA